MVVVDGYIGSDPQFRTRARLVMEAANANDFFDASYTKNGRTTWPFSYVDPWSADQIAPAEFLLILNRNENIVPGVARLDPTQAAAYFMLGETTGTSAGGKDEEGKFLRVPGTNPFFPRDMADMGNRMLELLNSRELQAFVLNTGRVGGGDGQPESNKVTIPCSSAIVRASSKAPSSGPRTRTSATRWRRRCPEWTTSRSCSPAGSMPGRAGRASTRPWRPGSSGSARTSSVPSPAWTSPWSSRWADHACGQEPASGTARNRPAARPGTGPSDRAGTQSATLALT